MIKIADRFYMDLTVSHLIKGVVLAFLSAACGMEQGPDFPDHGSVAPAINVMSAGIEEDPPDSDTERVLIVVKAKVPGLREPGFFSQATVRFGEVAGKESEKNQPDATGNPGTTVAPFFVSVPETDEWGNLSYFNIMTKVQDSLVKLDILWVIDSSQSMKHAQQSLGANFRNFLSAFSRNHYDFQMAVTTTDICNGDYDGNLDPCPDPPYINYSGSPETNLKGAFFAPDDQNPVLSSNDPDLSGRFFRLVQVGTHGSGFEHGLKATELAVTKVMSGENPPLIREGGFLAVIIVSDEEDDGIGLAMNEGYLAGFNPTESGKTGFSYTAGELINWLDQVRGKGHYAISAVTRTRDLSTGVICDYPHAKMPDLHKEEGTAYREAARKTGGGLYSICSPDWGEKLAELGHHLRSQASMIALRSPPVPGTIRLLVNDSEVFGWELVEEQQSIRFHSGLVPPSESIIRIEYTSKVP